MKRRDVKEVHENAVLEKFKNYCLKNGETLTIISQPDPPDAIVEINEGKTWIEITDAFLSRELAESITSHIAEDKKHKPISKGKRIVIEPTNQFSNTLKEAILKKYTKASIRNVYKEYGQGILLVGIITPFSDAKEAAKSDADLIRKAISSEEKCFQKIYFYNVNNDVFIDINI